LKEEVVGEGGEEGEAELLPFGTPVRIVGLVSAPQLNETTGIAKGLDEATQRWKVMLIDGTYKKFKRRNLVNLHQFWDSECSKRFSGESLEQSTRARFLAGSSR